MCMSRTAVKNYRHLRRCITIASLGEPLFMVAARPWLSQWNTVLLCLSGGPQTAQLMIMGNSSLAMILMEDHSVGDGSWNQKPAKTVLKPQEPEASVWSGTQKMSG